MTVRSYRAKKGAYIDEIRYQFRINTVGCVKVSGVKTGLRFKNICYNIEKKKNVKNYLLFFVVYKYLLS